MSDNITILSEQHRVSFDTNNTAATVIKMARNITSEWASSARVLKQGEPGAELLSDGRIRFKIGDGSNTWSNLPYAVCAVDDGELT